MKILSHTNNEVVEDVMWLRLIAYLFIIYIFALIISEDLFLFIGNYSQALTDGTSY